MTEPQPIERTSRNMRNGGVGLCGAIAILCFWPVGCSLILVGEPVQEVDLTNEDPAEENLKAIRAMLANLPHRTEPSKEKSQSDSSAASPS
jgi:hypothetical protein